MTMKGHGGAVSVPQSDPEDCTFWFEALVGQEPRDREAGAKTKCYRVKQFRRVRVTGEKEYRVLYVEARSVRWEREEDVQAERPKVRTLYV